MKEIQYISFWKRNPLSVEETMSTTLHYVKGCFEKENGKKYTKKESDELITQLFDVLKIEDSEDQFKALLYENDKEDYRIKFFLEIAYKDATYLAIKGTQPFKQKNYKEIQALFEPLLKEE